MNPASRIYGLDILRTAAIFYVMLSHGYAYSGKFLDINYYRWLTTDGVGLFFVLSGFLVGGILIRKTEQTPFRLHELLNFWKRRWLRTLPAYFCVLSLLIACYYIQHNHLPPLWQRYYVFTQNFASPHPVFFTEAWSLSVEEWFYLLIPFILFIILRINGQTRWKIFSLILSVLIFITSYRLHKFIQINNSVNGLAWSEYVKVVLTRMDGIMYGVLGAWFAFYYHREFYKHKNRLLIAGILGLIACNLINSEFFYTHFYYSLAPIATLCLIPALSSLKQGEGKFCRVITFISTISYSMYLTNHMIVQRGVLPFLSKMLHLNLTTNQLHNVLAYILFWMLTLICSYALYRFVEKPFMALRNKRLQHD